MTAAPPIDLVDIFTPTAQVKRVPYNGFTPEEYEAREAEKKLRRARMRSMRERAQDPDTENRDLWSCLQCFVPFTSGDAMWLTYNPHEFTFAAKCEACHQAMSNGDGVPARRSQRMEAP